MRSPHGPFCPASMVASFCRSGGVSTVFGFFSGGGERTTRGLSMAEDLVRSAFRV